MLMQKQDMQCGGDKMLAMIIEDKVTIGQPML